MHSGSGILQDNTLFFQNSLKCEDSAFTRRFYASHGGSRHVSSKCTKILLPQANNFILKLPFRLFPLQAHEQGCDLKRAGHMTKKPTASQNKCWTKKGAWIVKRNWRESIRNLSTFPEVHDLIRRHCYTAVTWIYCQACGL